MTMLAMHKPQRQAIFAKDNKFRELSLRFRFVIQQRENPKTPDFMFSFIIGSVKMVLSSICPEYVCAILGVITAKLHNYPLNLIPQERFCVIGGRRDRRLFHVELREIFVTPG